MKTPSIFLAVVVAVGTPVCAAEPFMLPPKYVGSPQP